MRVLRIVPDISADRVEAAKMFYEQFLGLSRVMDQGWIATFAAEGQQQPQISVMTQGGSGAPVPDLSIEVDDIDEAHQRAERLELEIAYPMTREPWGVRRFFVRDPFGRLVNVLAHDPEG